MNKHFTFFCLIVCFVTIASEPIDSTETGKLVCIGRVEPIEGEVDVAAQMSGILIKVPVKEGQWVTNGTVLAEVDARREEATLELAKAKLARVRAGNGKEEIAASDAVRDAVAAELDYAEGEFARAEKLRGQRVISEEELDLKRQRAMTLRKQLMAAKKNSMAMKRGPLPEDILLAEAEVGVAQAAYDLRLVRAQSSGVILRLYRHVGDSVNVFQSTPILQMAETKHLRIRLEVNEQDVHRIKEGISGSFNVFGVQEIKGRLLVKQILPSFAARRLFEPDSTARLDTRTLNVLCDLEGIHPSVFSGQRIIAKFGTSGK